MEECRFSRPVVVGSGGSAVIADLGEAFAALHRGSLGGHRLDIPEWQIAFDRVVRAKLDPKPDKVEEARAALQVLANRGP
jgi:hypothetical protein